MMLGTHLTLSLPYIWEHLRKGKAQVGVLRRSQRKGVTPVMRATTGAWPASSGKKHRGDDDVKKVADIYESLCFRYSLTSFLPQPCEAGIIIIPILQMSKVKHREVK